MDFNRMINGMVRAIRLDTSFYEEVEHDPSYNQDALGVVILVSVVGAIGSFLGSLIGGRGFISALFGLIVGVVLAIVWYYFWVYIAHFIGTRFFKGTGDRGEVQRAFGFAYSPQILGILAFIPCVGGLIAIVAWLWSIVCGFVAIRQSLDQDNANAALTVIISGVVVFIISAIVTAILGGLGLGVAALTGAFNG
jgi:hypothetical protein